MNVLNNLKHRCNQILTDKIRAETEAVQPQGETSPHAV
jgi:hypothetical protein